MLPDKIMVQIRKCYSIECCILRGLYFLVSQEAQVVYRAHKIGKSIKMFLAQISHRTIYPRVSHLCGK